MNPPTIHMESKLEYFFSWLTSLFWYLKICNPLIFRRQDQREDATCLRGRSVRGFAFQCEDHCRTLVPWIWWEKWRFRGCVSLEICDLQWWINDEIIAEFHLCIIEGFARFEEDFVLSRGMCITRNKYQDRKFWIAAATKQWLIFQTSYKPPRYRTPQAIPLANYESRNPFIPHWYMFPKVCSSSVYWKQPAEFGETNCNVQSIMH